MKLKVVLLFFLLLAIAGCKEDFQVDTPGKPQLIRNVLTLTVSVPDRNNLHFIDKILESAIVITPSLDIGNNATREHCISQLLFTRYVLK